MGELNLAAPLAAIASRGRITADDVLTLRRGIFADGIVTRAEAEALFALDAACAETCAAWTAFVIEAITDFIVHQEQPAGYVSEANADWLLDMIAHDGTVDTVTELELLIHVLEKAASAPEALSAYALEQVAYAVLDGAGPLAKGRALSPGMVGEAEVDLIRRILHASGSGSAITRPEAEVLFRINDRTVEEMNDPSWNELFVKSLANHVLGGTGHVVATRVDALRRDDFFATDEVDLPGFFRRMVAGGASAVFDGIESDDGLEGAWRERNARRAEDEARAARVGEDEATWLADLIGRDRLIHDNERALLAFIAAEAIDVHPALAPLVAKVA